MRDYLDSTPPPTASTAPAPAALSLPHDLELERAALCSLILHNELAGEAGRLAPHHFYSAAHAAVYSAVQRLAAQGKDFDALLLRAELLGSPLPPGMDVAATLGAILRGVGAVRGFAGTVQRVLDLARRRAMIRTASEIVDAASNGRPTEVLDDLAASIAATDQSLGWKPDDLSDLAVAGDRVVYLTDSIFPLGMVTLWSAEGKVGKSLFSYRLAMDFATGYSPLGHFTAIAPVPVVIFQLEMPEHISKRRMERIARALGPSYLADVLEAAGDGRLRLFSRPPGFDCMQPSMAREFARASRGAGLVIIDSGTAAMPGADANQTQDVDRLFQAIGSEATRAVQVLHHKRKPPPGHRPTAADNRAAVIGSQRWFSASGDIWGLSRGETPEPKYDGGLHAISVHLSHLGAWTPEDITELTLRAEDDRDDTRTYTWVEDAAPLDVVHALTMDAGAAGVRRQVILDRTVGAGLCSTDAIQHALRRAVGKRELVKSKTGKEVVYYQPPFAPSDAE